MWHSQLPSWVSSLPLNQVQAAMEAHITTEATHYKGQVYSWDVVNEPFNDDGTPRQDVFYNAFGGTGYIADALKTAHAADPDAKLYLNDYNIEGSGAKSDAMYALVSSLKSQGVPIDGVGFESHFILGQVPSTMKANMARFAALGLNVAVTELDDRIQLPATAANLAQQATDYAAVVNDCLGVTGCVGVSQWGVGDADSWIPGFFSGYGSATMYDQNYQPKPAYNAVVTALGGTVVSSSLLVLEASTRRVPLDLAVDRRIRVLQGVRRGERLEHRPDREHHHHEHQRRDDHQLEPGVHAGVRPGDHQRLERDLQPRPRARSPPPTPATTAPRRTARPGPSASRRTTPGTPRPR